MSSTLVANFKKAVLKQLTEMNDDNKNFSSVDPTVDIYEGFDVYDGEMIELNNNEDNDALAEHFTVLVLTNFNIRQAAMQFFTKYHGNLIQFITWLEYIGYVKPCNKAFFIDNTEEPFVLDKTN